MAKKKKHIRIPNGYGSIRYIGANRTLPYAVHPPAHECENGIYKRPKAICYVPDWYTGFAVLSAYHSGTYKPGMELDIQYDSNNIEDFCRKVLSKTVYQAHSGVTLEQVYNYLIDAKFGENAPKKLSQATRNALDHGYGYLSDLKNRPIQSITIDDVQQLINSCQKKQATKENIKYAVSQIWAYALSRDYCDKNISSYIVIPAGGEDEHGVPFNDEELQMLWEDCEDPIAQLCLIMCYSGFRVSALKTLKVNVTDMYFKGGVKTAASKNRIVPIHSAIQEFVPYTLPANYQAKVNHYLKAYHHTAHDCRHTFSMLCERYGVNEADRKRMMGHSFGSDITNAIYGHRTVEELRCEIEKIEVENSVSSCVY